VNQAAEILSHLNALGVGELDAVRGKLGQARDACRQIDQPELADKLQEAVEALGRADMRTYRKRLETVVARLGHLK
jgi:hypothetical protein